ncbi:hypothetical protein EUX98_g5241 [Antrodiella citrinella]|uniref:Uncharacterized protein n=1 Tax=Antrodiella citrinella TaxID=2447956 RepID=A0A4V6S1U3_9APHY|nr:hypothetical protein EUX98_g5241 [Antrodiella citrinella]
MPVKRKASKANMDGSPPPKRRTRSGGPLVVTQPTAVSPRPLARRRTAPTSSSIENVAVDSSDDDEELPPPPRRGRKPIKPAAIAARPPFPSSPSPPRTRLRASTTTKKLGTVPAASLAVRKYATYGGLARKKAQATKIVSSESSASDVEEPVASSSKLQLDNAPILPKPLTKSSKPPARGRPAPRARGGKRKPASRSRSKVLDEALAEPDDKALDLIEEEEAAMELFNETAEELEAAEAESATVEVLAEVAVAEEPMQEVEAAQSTDSEPDELLLRSPPSSPPVTPPRSVGARPKVLPRPNGSAAGTPRMFLDCVEPPPTPSRLRSQSKGLTSRARTLSVVPPSPKIQSLPVPSTPTRARFSATPQPSRKRSTPIVEEDDELETFPEELPVEVLSPTKRTPGRTYGKGKGKAIASPAKEASRSSAEDVELYLEAQKRATLSALHRLPQMMDLEDMDVHPNSVAHKQLTNLLLGTVQRGEGNSCLITGPRASGKSRLVEDVIASLPEVPNVIRLSGHAQTNDRLAMREIAWQLAQQSGTSLMSLDDPDDESNQDADNPFLDKSAEPSVLALPPPAHLLALISMIPTLSRPTIIVLDGFDLFALHARQSLLYCLFDTVQHARVGANGKGLAVIGVTSRVDTINLLEKRVKSRFSGRIFRTACPGELSVWISTARRALCAPIDVEASEEWTLQWDTAVDKLLDDTDVQEALQDTFSLTRDLRMLSRILIPLILELTPTSPLPTSRSSKSLVATLQNQRCPTITFLHAVTYPSMCLLIAAMHARTSGHDTFTFEMLYETFCDQVRTSHSAPVQVQGGGIGMVRCSREVLMAEFERLATLGAVVVVSAPSQGTSKGFMRYRCSINRIDVKEVVEKMGQLSLKKWFSKAT